MNVVNKCQFFLSNIEKSERNTNKAREPTIIEIASTCVSPDIRSKKQNPNERKALNPCQPFKGLTFFEVAVYSTTNP